MAERAAHFASHNANPAIGRIQAATPQAESPEKAATMKTLEFLADAATALMLVASPFLVSFIALGLGY